MTYLPSKWVSGWTLARGPGDGRVLRTSALLDERAGSPWRAYVRSPVPWDNVLFLFPEGGHKGRPYMKRYPSLGL